MVLRSPLIAHTGDRPHPVFLIPAIVFAWTAITTAERYSPLPWLDQWNFLAEYQDLLDHGFSLGWLLASHNGHRIATARPFFAADLAWFGGRNTFLIICIWLVQISGAYLFVRLVGDARRGPKAIGLALAISLLFSLMQWQNFLQGFQLAYVAVFALGGWGAAILLGGERLTPPRLLGGLSLVLLTTLTLANGFLIGAAIGFACGATRMRLRLGLALIALSLILAVIFAATLGAARPSILQVFDPTWWVYVTIYVGNVWGYRIEPWVTAPAIVAGSLGLVLFGAAITRVGQTPDSARSTLLAVMTFTVLTAMLTAFGRLFIGLGEALDSRFSTPSAYFWAANAVFWANEVVAIRDRPLSRGAAMIGLVALSALAFPLQWAGYNETSYFARKVETAERLLRTHQDSEAVLVLSNHDAAFFRRIADSYPRSLAILRAHHLSIF